ncbi:MAG: HEAT repeat domain-containing protein [Roseivirga sp.]|nr:HEAT repeat domain-containing protein [Roseivirga sp.]
MAITDKKLASWAEKRDLKKLHEALSEHNFKIRLGAIAHLAEIKDDSSLEHLERLVDDSFVVVLEAAAEAVRSMNADRPSLRVFEQRIKAKKNIEQKIQTRTKASFKKVRAEQQMATAESERSNSDQKADEGSDGITKVLKTIGIVVLIIIVFLKLIRTLHLMGV